MNYDFDLLNDRLISLEENKFPKWGKMNSIQMIIHCNNFIEVSLGYQKIVYGQSYLEGFSENYF